MKRKRQHELRIAAAKSAASLKAIAPAIFALGEELETMASIRPIEPKQVIDLFEDEEFARVMEDCADLVRECSDLAAKIIREEKEMEKQD